jgi:hypothetical protein
MSCRRTTQREESVGPWEASASVGSTATDVRDSDSSRSAFPQAHTCSDSPILIVTVAPQFEQTADVARNGLRQPLGHRETSPCQDIVSKCIADALVADVRKEAEAHGVDVLTWLTRAKSTDDYRRMRIAVETRGGCVYDEQAKRRRGRPRSRSAVQIVSTSDAG